MISKLRWHIWVWYEGIRFAISQFLRSFEPCPKERAGYTCHHRLLSNGKRECGDD